MCTDHTEKMRELDNLKKEVDDVLKDANLENINDKIDKCNAMIKESGLFPGLVKKPSIRGPIKR